MALALIVVADVMNTTSSPSRSTHTGLTCGEPSARTTASFAVRAGDAETNSRHQPSGASVYPMAGHDRAVSEHEHTYRVTVAWTGNRGDGTASYRNYDRANEVRADGPPMIEGSSDPAFRGDPRRWNPEQLLVASLSQC